MEFEDRIPKLITRYLRGDLTASQQRELLDWVNEADANRLYFIQATDEKRMTEKFRHFNQEDITQRMDKTLESIDHGNKSTGKAIMRKMKKYTIAASFVLIAGSIIYYAASVFNKKDIAKTPTTIKTNTNDVQPGTEKAVLILADGSKVILDNTTNGTIAQQGNTVVLKEDGLLAYNTDKTKSQSEIIYNTLKTERGGEYRSLVLSDGTKIWLNSVSSIHYPTAFIGKERIVDITGEVYFEVAKNRTMPFKVNVNGMQVEVLGTHFNINSYGDEEGIKTTLMEGAVKIVAARKVSFLKPGQQAILRSAQDDKGEIKIVSDVDVNETVAWKNGLFIFDGSDIKTIMRQASRWYDIDVVFQDQIPGHFVVTGVPRTLPISKLLKALEMMGGVHFEIEGKKILVKR